MMSGLYKIGSRLMLESQRQEIIAQNLAGAGTCGFKGRYLAADGFHAHLARLEDSQSVSRGDKGTPVVDFSQGSLTQTQRSLDFAIIGDGFFRVQTAEGATLLTRNGSFMLSPAGFLVTQEGHTVLGDSGPIRLEPTDDVTRLQVSETGHLQVPDAVGGAMRTVATMGVHTVQEPQRLIRVSASYYLPDADQKVIPAPEARLCNGHQEQPNVSSVREMAAMIQSLREFEAGHKMIQTMNDLARDEGQKTA